MTISLPPRPGQQAAPNRADQQILHRRHNEQVPRRRAMAALLISAALMNGAMAAASAVSTIAAAGQLGAAWAAVPNCAGIAGTGIGAVAMTYAMRRWGRRAAFVLGYAAAGLGGGLAAAGAAGQNAAALTSGMLLLGLGNAGAQLSRYAAAEMYPAQQRARAIGALLWAAAAGAVGGPLLMAPASTAATMLGGAAMTGPFLFAALATVAAAIAAASLPPLRVAAAATPLPLRALGAAPAAKPALTVMLTGQVVMVAVMTATPLAMHMGGQGLGAVGIVLSAHTFGMFALSPLTGWLADHFGSRPVMLGGLAVLTAATTLAAASGELPSPRTAALFLLGYGWNLCFIGGSAHLARDLPVQERARIEGAVDGGVWAAAAVTSLSSTALLAASGYAGLSAVAGVLVVVPALTLIHRPRPPAGLSSG